MYVALWAADYRWPNAGDKIRSNLTAIAARSTGPKRNVGRCPPETTTPFWSPWVRARKQVKMPKVNQGLTPCVT